MQFSLMSARLSDEIIAAARAVRIEHEIARRSVRLRGRGTERVGPCPVCGGHDRFAINIKKQTWNCRGCGKGGGDAISLAMHMDGSNFPGAVERITASAELPAGPTQAPTKPEQSSPDNAESRVQDALDIFDAAADLRGTPGEDYLRRDRELETADDFSSFRRWDAWNRALIGLFRDICTDEPSAITRIFLDADAHKITRKFLGPVGGCAIKIDPDEDVTMGVCIGEGLETCLAARQLGLRPVWALGSVGGIAKFPVLAGIDGLHLLRENDANGASDRAGEECRRRWLDSGREVIVLRPKFGSDANDALRRLAQ